MYFITEFFKSPLQTGAVVSPSRKLPGLVVETTDPATKECVVELGLGTRGITKEIARKINPTCLLLTLEINKHFADKTQRDCPEVIVFNASETEINKYLEEHNRDSCECVISAIPWSMFDRRKQECILLDVVYNSLGVNGIFLTIACIQNMISHSGIRFKRMLKEKFRRVQKTCIT